MSNPSRFDKSRLLTSKGGRYVNECLYPEFNQYQCDVRLKEDLRPLLPNTKCVLLLGESALSYKIPDSKGNTLKQMRGSVLQYKSLPAIASFFPQDAVDIKDYESEFNAQEDNETEDRESDEDALGEKSRHGRTRRKNYGFWLKKDIEKCKQLIKNNGQIPISYQKPNYIIYPESSSIIGRLLNASGLPLYIDIETDSNLNILCFSISFGLPDIYIIPCIMPNYSWAYSDLPSIFHALSVAFNKNEVIAHNGSGFDFFVFAFKYRIAIGKRSYDTMIAHHRCFPEVEKSLGHCTSCWTWEPFHKDEGNVGYGTMEHAKQLWNYCGKDVYTMILIREAIDKYAKSRIGLTESIAAANRAIRPYLIATLQGIKYDETEVQETLNENDKLMMIYLEWIEYLVGKDNLKRIRGTGKSSLASSSTQCCRYFHDELGYEVVARGKERKDGTRAPSLAKEAIFKLKLKYPENIVLDVIIAFRELAKESSMIKFEPFNFYEELHNNEQ